MATIDPDEAQLSKLAKKVLALPPKPRSESKLWKVNKTKEKMHSPKRRSPSAKPRSAARSV